MKIEHVHIQIGRLLMASKSYRDRQLERQRNAPTLDGLVRLSRSERAGRAVGDSLSEMVHLMYQNDTAARFWRGLMYSLRRNRRKPNNSITGAR